MDFPCGRGTVPIEQKDIQRFFSKIFKTEPCWDWLGKPMNTGYGTLSIRFQGRNYPILAHRFSYWLTGRALFHGDEMYVIHHTCQNRLCVNPNHLQQTSQSDHVDAGHNIEKAKTHCKRGHPLLSPNLYKNRSKPNARICKKCTLMLQENYRRKNPFGYQKKNNGKYKNSKLKILFRESLGALANS
jgi:hypothetical protein